ncbi:MAG: metallophosphoesterase family protein [Planctomycetota bacterium]|jgi:diadenosine tetraphosphatase ApaH/serine/threonine PP2A family protein phosphatase|nr:metallophosphoesterase family protein [Planctomycetota bacterium]MDP7254087.1 metallophosphoesterase family protein [Planctomycetota bacterium]
MKIAVLGDIHGNLQALKAVLADVDTIRPGKAYCHGDVVGYGANPRECLQLVRERGWPVIAGNWELAVAGDEACSPEEFNPRARLSVYYCRGALSREEKNFLRDLPQEIVEGGVQIVHGSTVPHRAKRYVLKVEDAEEAFGAAQAMDVFMGHTHIQLIYLNESPVSYSSDDVVTIPPGVSALINTGAVGQPRDRDPRARYCLYDTETRTVEWRRIEYDREKAASLIREEDLPEIFADRLLTGQ